MTSISGSATVASLNPGSNDTISATIQIDGTNPMMGGVVNTNLGGTVVNPMTGQFTLNMSKTDAVNYLPGVKLDITITPKVVI